MDDVRTFLRRLQAEGSLTVGADEARELKEILKRPVVKEWLRQMGEKVEGQTDGLLNLNFGDPRDAARASEVKGYTGAVVDFVGTAWEIINVS